MPPKRQRLGPQAEGLLGGGEPVGEPGLALLDPQATAKSGTRDAAPPAEVQPEEGSPAQPTDDGEAIDWLAEYGPRPLVAFGPEVDAYLDHLLRDIGRLGVEMESLQVCAAREKARIQEAADQEAHLLLRRQQRLQSELLLVARGYDYGTRKSRKLLHGEFGSRAVPARLEIVDEAKALAFAKEHGVHVYVKEEPRVSHLAAWMKGAPVDEGTGEVEERPVPDGCILHPPGRTWYVTPTPPAPRPLEVPDAR